MKKIKKTLYLAILCSSILILTGCVQALRDDDNNAVQNPDTGQNLTANIICQPTEADVIALYEENNKNIDELPVCEDVGLTSGGYQGVWYNIFIQPLAVGIVQLGQLVGNLGLSIVLIGVIIRVLLLPITKKIAIQSENTKKAKPELEKLEKKFKGKTDQENIMKKNQEMSAIYKKHNINPVIGCLFALVQLPIFIAFFESINRVPVIFEASFLTLHLGMTPLKGIQTGNYIYIILILLLIVTTYYSFNFSQKDMGPVAGPFQSKAMIYGLIIFMTILAFNFPTAILLYWVTSSTFTIGQNLWLQRGKKDEEPIKEEKKEKPKKGKAKGGKKHAKASV